MSRAPNWNLEEFEIVVKSSDLSDEEVGQQLPRRTIDAVQVVRQGIHRFHTGGNQSLLSQMMKQRLTTRQERLICSVCKAEF
jgi:hypothetical protein